VTVDATFASIVAMLFAVFKKSSKLAICRNQPLSCLLNLPNAAVLKLFNEELLNAAGQNLNLIERHWRRVQKGCLDGINLCGGEELFKRGERIKKFCPLLFVVQIEVHNNWEIVLLNVCIDIILADNCIDVL